MMRLGLSGVALLLSVLPAMAEDGDGLSAKVVQCLRDNAARVEAAEPDLTKATNFLISGPCAAPVAEEQRRLNKLRSLQIAERNRNQCRDRIAALKVQDQTSPPRFNRVYEDCNTQYDNATNNLAIANPLENSFLAGFLGDAHPSAVTSMAANLILDLRVAHNKTRP